MKYEELFVLIPSHSIEDFPTELEEDEATGILNAFSIIWHPVLLAEAGVIPNWHRSDEPPETHENRLIIIPKASEEWLPGGWADHARLNGAVVLTDLQERQELIEAALAPLEKDIEVDPDLVADFCALGTCYLQIELLTTHMHHYSNMDEVHLQREAVAAAEAAVSGDAEACRIHLRSCFESLMEARERFYPVECFLIDLCLLIPRLADDQFRSTLLNESPTNFLVSAKDLQTINDEHPEMLDLLREAWDGGRADILGGEYEETPSPLMPLESVIWNFQEGFQVFHKLCGRTPKTWGRRRFGLSTDLPQILNKFGQIAAYHLAMDDGIYPDAEQGKVRWEGCDGTILDAMTRIPLAADSATSYLRFAMRMAESMEEDHVAAIVFARWPEVKAPWFEDLIRTQAYSPCLGKFVTMEDFFENTEDPGRMSSFEAGEYLSPFLLQSVAGQETNPISRYREHTLRRLRFDAACWSRTVAGLLRQIPISKLDFSEDERLLELADPDADEHAIQTAENMLQELESDSAHQLANIIMEGAGNEPGFLLFNSLAHARTVSVILPELQSPPAIEGPVKGVQFDETSKMVTVNLPPCGFQWIPANSPAIPETPSRKKSVPTAEENVLRNEFFEVWMNPDTGGIGRIKGYGRVPNRLSQQIAFRFAHERTWTVGEGDDIEQFHSYYSEMRCHASRVICDGPHLGEIETEGDLIDQTDGSRLAGFRQNVRVWRGRKIVEIDLELDVDVMPSGDPWTNYIATRFAWNDSTAALTRSVHQGAQGIRGERFESLHYFEIATPEERTTIINHGQGFHRKSGPRMLDTLLVVEGESQRKFRFTIALDDPYPLQAALNAMSPPTLVTTTNGPPQFGTSGWFFHVDAKNVQILRIMGREFGFNEQEKSEWEAADQDQSFPDDGFALRLLETEGRTRRVTLQCFREPKQARQRDFEGRTITDLAIENGAVIVEMTAYEIADVELSFQEPEADSDDDISYSEMSETASE
ncbi:MAG: hypothetical protein Tsb009_15830 [Planctomycetaceae bacterium]